MCGIFGHLRCDPGQVVDPELVRRGVDLLRHRGPDHQEVVRHENFCFGHARLAILDLKTGDQPLWNHDRTGCITYNGELYNFKELRKDLEGRGRQFVTHSDTEVVLQAYREWGSACLGKFRGMFAFVAVDLAKKQVLVARDRFGEKPLYMTRHPRGFFFASELEALYRTVGPFSIDLEAVEEYLSWQYIQAPRTIYREVQALLPAHFLTFPLGEDPTGASMQRYWHLDFAEDTDCSPQEWKARCAQGLQEAVAMRLQSDVPFGVFLSGGIDSGLVLADMHDCLKKPVKAFTIGFQEPDFDETAPARRVALASGAEHICEVCTSEVFQMLPTLVRHFGQPFADSSALPTFLVSRLAAQQVKMVLSGDGADEHFAGYSRYPYILGGVSVRAEPPGERFWRRLGLLKLARRLDRWWHPDSARPSFADDLAVAFSRHNQACWHFSPAHRRELWQPRYRYLVQDLIESRRRRLEEVEGPLITRIQHLDMMTYLPYDILTKVDTCSMAHSLEVRTPFLDHPFAEMIARMPVALKIPPAETPDGKGFATKFLLRELARDRFGAEAADRPKKGFGVPLAAWFSGPLLPEISRRLLQSETLGFYFERAALEKLVDAQRQGISQSTRIWNLLFLEEWLSTHRDALS
jgi:asparagine synthase (glutamine-hydrolysing)